MWSVSYGWPEAAHASMDDHNDEVSYLQRSNSELMKLAVMGVTILVSSGDDGAPGYSHTCPSDPTRPVLGDTCPLARHECKCADFLVEKRISGVTRSCNYPMGAVYGEIYPEGTPGADCELLLNVSASTSKCHIGPDL